MLNSNVGGNLPGYKPRRKIGVKNKKIRESFQESPNTANRFYRGQKKIKENYQWCNKEMFQNCKI